MKYPSLFKSIFFGLFLLIFSMKGQADMGTIYDFSVKTIEGQEVSLSDYKGKVLLIVNTASRCGYTSQYKSLEALYQKYQAQGFTILAFPANNFMNQEPGTDQEIKQFCSLKYQVTFPLFSKISVKGQDIHPLYDYLTKTSSVSGPISWNFNKFLISKEGVVLARFGSTEDPLSPKLVALLEKALV